MRPTLRRAPATMGDRGARAVGVPGWLVPILRVPLAAKLAGANALIVMSVAAVMFAEGATARTGELGLVFGAALGGSLVINVVLVAVALRPLRDLELTAKRIWRGDLEARVPPSLLADGEMTRLGGAVNVLLDGLTADREHMRQLATEVIRAGDRERAYIARELHDSTAQTLAALLFQVSVAEKEATDAQLAERLRTIKQITTDVLEDVRMLAHTVHPRVLDDLGLVAALRNLARAAEGRSSANIEVLAAEQASSIPPAVAAVLYRVAQEAVGNALRHASPSTITISISVQDRQARLDVIDDGVGFDVSAALDRRPGMGLFTMQERVSLVDGKFEIESAPSRGTRVTASIPFDSRGSHEH